MVKRLSFNHITHEGSDNRLHLVKMPLKEVFCTLHCYQTFRRRHILEPLNCESIRSLFIFCALNNEFGLVTTLEILTIKHASWHSQANHHLYTIINGSNSHRYICSKRKAAQDDREA